MPAAAPEAVAAKKEMESTLAITGADHLSRTKYSWSTH